MYSAVVGLLAFQQLADFDGVIQGAIIGGVIGGAVGLVIGVLKYLTSKNKK